MVLIGWPWDHQFGFDQVQPTTGRSQIFPSLKLKRGCKLFLGIKWSVILLQHGFCLLLVLERGYACMENDMRTVRMGTMQISSVTSLVHSQFTWLFSPIIYDHIFPLSSTEMDIKILGIEISRPAPWLGYAGYWSIWPYQGPYDLLQDCFSLLIIGPLTQDHPI